MRVTWLFTLVSIALLSCARPAAVEPKCSVDGSWASLMTDSTLVFPFGTENFWIYDDSTKSQEDSVTRFLRDDFLLTARRLYLLEGKYFSIDFNQWLPQLTLKNDTFYFTERVTTSGSSQCYQYYPLLFRTDTVTVIRPDRGTRLIPGNRTVITKLGPLSYDYVYDDGNHKFYFNSRIGIVREEVLSTTGAIIRSKTLNKYSLR